MKVLDKKDATVLTSDEIRQDVVAVARKDYQRTVPQFLKAVKTGEIDKRDYAVRELLVWIEALPSNDLVFVE